MAGERTSTVRSRLRAQPLDGDWGRDARATERSRPAARARGRDRRQPRGARRARVAQRRQGDLLGQGGAPPGASRTSASTPRRSRSIAGRSNPIGGSLLFYSLKEPVGVAAQIVPWNYPLHDGDLEARARARRRLLGRAEARSADAADGAPARASSQPRSASRPASINVVPGDGPTTGAYLVRHPGVDKVAFTGSTRTGGEIMRLCSDPIKRLTLELGGKSPNLVFADAEPRRRDPELGLVDLLRGRPELRGALARARRDVALRRGRRREFAELARQHQGRRPARSGDADGLARSRRRTATGCTASSSAARARAPRSSRAARSRDGHGRVLPADRARGASNNADDRRAGGDLRPGRHGHPVRGREGRDPHRERRPLRPHGDGLDRRPGARPPRRARRSSRARSASTCRTPRSRASRSAATSSPASDASSRSRRSTSTSRRRA